MTRPNPSDYLISNLFSFPGAPLTHRATEAVTAPKSPGGHGTPSPARCFRRSPAADRADQETMRVGRKNADGNASRRPDVAQDPKSFQAATLSSFLGPDLAAMAIVEGHVKVCRTLVSRPGTARFLVTETDGTRSARHGNLTHEYGKDQAYV